MPAKGAVHYVAVKTGGSQQRCGVCRNFKASNKCTKVEGEISPVGYCNLFEGVGVRG